MITDTRLRGTDPPARSPLGGETMEWRVHLASAAPQKAWGVLLVIGLSTGLAAWLWRGPLPALGVAFALLGAVAEFLFPLHYRLSPEGAEMRCFLTRRAIAWPAVRRAYRVPDGVKLSPLDGPSRREPFRGVFLRFADNEAEVMKWVFGVRCSVLGSDSSGQGSKRTV